MSCFPFIWESLTLLSQAQEEVLQQQEAVRVLLLLVAAA